jgi:hypothetical protein
VGTSRGVAAYHMFVRFAAIRAVRGVTCPGLAGMTTQGRALLPRCGDFVATVIIGGAIARIAAVLGDVVSAAVLPVVVVVAEVSVVILACGVEHLGFAVRIACLVLLLGAGVLILAVALAISAGCVTAIMRIMVMTVVALMRLGIRIIINVGGMACACAAGPGGCVVVGHVGL